MALYSFSNYLEDKIINSVLRGESYTAGDVYVALFTSDPTEVGTGNEVSAASYSRQQITFGTPVDGQSTNSVEVLFPIAQESWGTITHAAIYDSQTGGNMLFYSPLEVSKTINKYSQFRFPTNYVIVKVK